MTLSAFPMMAQEGTVVQAGGPDGCLSTLSGVLSATVL